MKKLFLMVMAVGMIGVTQAQRTSVKADDTRMERADKKMTPEERAKKKTAKMTEMLSLDDKQQQVVYEVTLEQITDRERNRMQREEMQSRAMASREKSEQRIADVLTPEQKAKWEKEKSTNKKMRSERRSEMKRAAPESREKAIGSSNKKDPETGAVKKK